MPRNGNQHEGKHPMTKTTTQRMVEKFGRQNGSAAELRKRDPKLANRMAAFIRADRRELITEASGHLIRTGETT